MRFLSMLSLLGLMAFIGFSAIGRGDVYEEPTSPCDQCEIYDEYEETIDPKVIVNETNITNYTWINIENEGSNWREDRGDRWDHRGRRHHRDRYNRGHHGGHYPPAVLPYPHHYQPICRIGRVGWSHWYDLWVGNRLFQRHTYGVVLNSYWHLVRTGQCIPR